MATPTQTQTDTQTPPLFFTTKTLAARFCVSRQTIHRWRLSGYLPKPCYAEGKTTLWSGPDIERWVAAGAPWSDLALAREALRIHGGAAGLRDLIRPELPGPESPGVAELLDRFEAKLNDCEALTRNLAGQVELGRMQSRMGEVRRELAILRRKQREEQ